MFNQFTYKQKFIAIIILFIILSLATYKKSYKHIFQAKEELNIIENELHNAELSFNDVVNLKTQIKALDELIGGHTSSPDLVQEQVLDFITGSKHQANVTTIENVHMFSNNNFLIYTNQIELEGTYQDLISLLYEIENKFNFSRVSNSQFYTKTNYRYNTKKLFLKITLQNYEKIK